jgi:hypothetical protein
MPMEESHTLNAFVQFIYHDMPAGDEVANTTRVLLNDINLRSEYTEMLAAKTELPKVLFNPSTEVLSKILQYSAKTAVDSCFL